MQQFAVYIPNPVASAAVGLSVAKIDPKSAIVGALPEETDANDALIYFEGNRFGSAGMVTFADRAMVAAGRLSRRYPTIARATVPRRALQRVGTFTVGQGVDVPDAASLIALAKYLELWTDEDLDSAELHRELRPSR
jgi:hypothetical protein